MSGLNLSTALRRIQLTNTCSSRVRDSIRLNRSLIQQGFSANYASSSSIPIPKTELEISQLLAKTNSIEERKQIFDNLLGIEHVQNILPPIPTAPSGINLVPLGRTKFTTLRTGIDVHHSPFEALQSIYLSILKTLEKIPQSTVYRQSVEATTKTNLNIIQQFHTDSQACKDPNQIELSIRAAEKELGVEMIETAVEQAHDEHQLALKMIEFQAWQELEDKPPTGQWEYFPVPPSTSYPKN